MTTQTSFYRQEGEHKKVLIKDINILASACVCVRVCACVRVYTLQLVLIEFQLVDFFFPPVFLFSSSGGSFNALDSGL